MRENPWDKIEAPKKYSAEQGVFDVRWFERFAEAGNFQAYEYFEGDKATRAAEKQAFLSGEKENPELDYPKLDTESIVSREEALLALKAEIFAEEKNSVVRQVYRWRINEKLAELRLMRAAAEGDMQRFGRYSKFVYGEPSEEIFGYTLAEFQNTVNKGLSSEDDTVRTIAEELQQKVGVVVDSHIPTLPSEEFHEQIAGATFTEFGDIINIPDKAKGEKWQGEEIRQIFEDALDEISADGWAAVIAKSDRSGINTSQEKKEIQVPENREVTTKQLKGLLVHEFGTHVKRRVNGERTRLKLLSLGLDRYEQGEEGVTTLREGVIAGKQGGYSGFDAHLPIGLALGLDGKKRNFRGVFEILKKYQLLKNLQKGLPLEEAKEKAETAAWNRSVRTFRGTNCRTPGVAFTKDMIYREGNIAVWDTVTKSIPGTNTPEMMRWSVGKYDPSEKRHIWVLNELGITDEDLENLEK